jgi:DNA-binding LytR/AlgR family response regulator
MLASEFSSEVSSMRIAVKVTDRRYVMLDVEEIYFLESDGHDTSVRTARRSRFRSVRSLGESEKRLKPLGFLRVHRSYLVNLDRVREVRLRKGDDNDWELKLDPPVNVVLPIGRGYVASLWKELRL